MNDATRATITLIRLQPCVLAAALNSRTACVSRRAKRAGRRCSRDAAARGPSGLDRAEAGAQFEQLALGRGQVAQASLKARDLRFEHALAARDARSRAAAGTSFAGRQLPVADGAARSRAARCRAAFAAAGRGAARTGADGALPCAALARRARLPAARGAPDELEACRSPPTRR